MTNKQPTSLFFPKAVGGVVSPQTAPFNTKNFWEKRAAATGNGLPKEVVDVLEKPLSWFKESATKKPGPGESPLTQVAFVLDESGSMETGKSVTIEGFNTQLNIVRDGAKEVGETRMTFTKFSDSVEVGYAGARVDVVQPLSDETFRPGGWTALYDAIGDTLATLLKQPGIDSPACATLVTIFTDGEENHSARYTADILRQLIERLEATGRWTFALVGPKGGVTELANLLAVDKSNITGFDPASVASRGQAMGLMASASISYMSARAVGSSQVHGLYDHEADDKP